MPDSATARRQNDPAMRMRAAVTAIEVWLMWLRRDLHPHSELAFAEDRMARGAATGLDRRGVPRGSGIGDTMEGGRPGPMLAIRAGINAQPIREATRLSRASTADGDMNGKMHAAVHDLHAETLVDVVEAAQHRQRGGAAAGVKPLMGAERISNFVARVSAFPHVGGGVSGRQDRLHNDRARSDERCIGLGAETRTRIALELHA